MKSKIIEKDGYRIHLYKTDKFKSIEVHVLLRNKADVDNHLLSALKQLLYTTSAKYKSKIDRFIKEEELYSASFNIDIFRYGREIMFDYSLEIIDPKLVKDDYMDDAITFLFDIINNPLFDETKLDEVKDKVIYLNRSRFEKPNRLAAYNASQMFFEADVDKSRLVTDEDTVKSITMDMIENKYKQIVNNSIIDIYALGNIDDSISDLIDKNNMLKSSDINLEFIMKVNEVDKVKECTDIKDKINQAQIIYLYNTPKYTFKEFFAISLLSIILGGGSLNSRLFNIVREKHHLCYNIGTVYNSFDGYLEICTSVDNKNIDVTMKLINEVFDSMESITDEELERAKAKMISNYESVDGNLSSIYYRLIVEELLCRPSIEEHIKAVNSITKEEVEKVFNLLKLNTIYVLKGE